MRTKENLVVIGGGETENVFDALQSDGINRVPMECVDEQRFESSIFLGLRPLRTVENQAGLDASADFVVLEFSQTAELFDAQLDHVE